MYQDPIIEEIHAIRLQIEAECEGDFAKLTQRAKQIEAQYQDRIVYDLDALRHGHRQQALTPLSNLKRV